MENGDIVLPSHVSYKVLKIHSFDPKLCTGYVELKTTLTIKCTKLYLQAEIMNYLQDNLKCRKNEVEHKVSDDKPEIERLPSMHWDGGD